MTKRLAKFLQTEVYQTPPSYISDIRTEFEDSELELRTAFYQLGNYLAAWQIAKDLEKHPVVLDR